VVSGIGGVGFGLVQLARAKGAKVIAVSRTEAKLKKAAELGAEFTIDASRISVGERVREITDGAGDSFSSDTQKTASPCILFSS